jgi:hypothetical protein
MIVLMREATGQNGTTDICETGVLSLCIVESKKENKHRCETI